MSEYQSKFGFEKLRLSPVLQQFFSDYAEWILAEFPKSECFSECNYICGSLSRWLKSQSYSILLRNAVYNEFTVIRKKLFNGDSLYPFSKWEGGCPDSKGIHNPARKDFILLYGSN